MTVREQALKLLNQDRGFKFRAWSEKHGMEYFDWLYWFEENCVNEMTGHESNGTFVNYIITQWTGLTDPNGKDIYEGDIVTGGHSGQLDIIVFECGCFSLKYAMMQYEATYWGSEVVVKGNIFETPELLKQISDEIKALGDLE